MVSPIALCFVTYYPHKDLLTRIKGALRDGYTVYIWDNTTNGDKIFHNIKEDNLFIHGNGINKGVGFALNKLLFQVHSEFFNLALYFDQDTLFSMESLKWIKNWLNHNELNSNETAVWNFKSNTLENEFKKSKPQNADFVISSGSLFNLSNISKIGWHNPNLFLECVDYELCARAHFSNFKISQISGCPGLNHYELQPFYSIVIFNRKFEFRLYSINRTFSFIFNLLKLSLKSLFKGHFMLAWYFFKNIISHLLNQTNAIFLSFVKYLYRS